MTVLRKDARLLPVWGAKYRVVSGLDPLGMQNASEAAFAALMPGITNLTNHIRYYGLYCWLLDHYSRHERSTAQVDQNRFLRRAEFIITLMMGHMDPDVQQVPGSLFANEQLNSDKTTFRLDELADKDGDKKTYWKYSSGAYGQYYTGAIREIGLNLLNEHGNFICSTQEEIAWNGTKVAKAFRSNIPDKAANMLLDCIKSGRVTLKELEELYPYFRLVPVPPETDEWKAYTDLLKDVDRPLQVVHGQNPGSHRRHTILHLLRFFRTPDEDENSSDFTSTVHAGHGTYMDRTDDTLMGWTYYQSNEYWHYGAGACLWAACRWLEEQGGQYQWNDWVPALAKHLLTSMKRLWKVAPTDKVQKVISKLPTLSKVDKQLYLHRDPEKDTMALGFAQVLALYDHDAEHLGKLRKTAVALGAERDGNVIQGMDWISNRLDMPLGQFVEAFLRYWVIHRHQHVALRKLAGTGSYTLKFIVDEGMVRLIQVFRPQYTSPRLQALVHILSDLGMLEDNETLTQQGEQYLQELE